MPEAKNLYLKTWLYVEYTSLKLSKNKLALYHSGAPSKYGLQIHFLQNRHSWPPMAYVFSDNAVCSRLICLELQQDPMLDFTGKFSNEEGYRIATSIKDDLLSTYPQGGVKKLKIHVAFHDALPYLDFQNLGRKLSYLKYYCFDTKNNTCKLKAEEEF